MRLAGGTLRRNQVGSGGQFGVTRPAWGAFRVDGEGLSKKYFVYSLVLLTWKGITLFTEENEL